MKKLIIILLILFPLSSHAVDIVEGGLACTSQEAINHYYFLQRTEGSDTTDTIMEDDVAKGSEDGCFRVRKKVKGAILLELGPTTKVKIKGRVFYVQGSHVFNIL